MMPVCEDLPVHLLPCIYLVAKVPERVDRHRSCHDWRIASLLRHTLHWRKDLCPDWLLGCALLHGPLESKALAIHSHIDVSSTQHHSRTITTVRLPSSHLCHDVYAALTSDDELPPCRQQPKCHVTANHHKPHPW